MGQHRQIYWAHPMEFREGKSLLLEPREIYRGMVKVRVVRYVKQPRKKASP